MAKERRDLGWIGRREWWNWGNLGNQARFGGDFGRNRLWDRSDRAMNGKSFDPKGLG
ncbi:hypothetical protein CsSME_00042153 [Camellia sinensis var. sinensis]